MEELHLHDLLRDKAIWHRFVSVLKSRKINNKSTLWYVRHAKNFLSKANNTLLHQLNVSQNLLSQIIHFLELSQIYFLL